MRGFNKLKWQEILRDDGVAGIVEKIFFGCWKSFWSVYYRFRFQSCGSSLVVTGPLKLRGAKRVRVGDSVLIEAGCEILTSPEGTIYIGDRGYLESGSRLSSKGVLRIGSRVSVLRGARLIASKQVELRDDVWIARNVTVEGADILLENEVILGPDVMIMDTDHRVNPASREVEMHAGESRPVRVRENGWIGARAVILKGVEIGARAVVGAGSIVTKNVAPDTVAAGNPAKLIDKR